MATTTIQKQSNNNNFFITWAYERVIRQTLIPLALMIITPNATVLLSYIVVHKNGDLSNIIYMMNIFESPSPSTKSTFWNELAQAWYIIDWFDYECWLLITGTLLWAMITLAWCPGEPSHYYGPPTTTNNYRPIYCNNSKSFYVLSMCLMIPLLLANTSVLHLYNKFPTIVGQLCALGWLITILLYVKGHLWPNDDSSPHYRSGNVIFDLYWGIELYPRFLGWIQLKQLINCRFGMFTWQLVVLVMCKAHYELFAEQYQSNFERGAHLTGWLITPISVSTVLQTIYIAKFFYWEDGYMQSIDITVDHFGYMLAWGCIPWLPTFFTLSSVYLVQHGSLTSQSSSPYQIAFCIAILLIGLAAIAINYDIDRQRQTFRRINGECLIWGKKPQYICAKYQGQMDDDKKYSLLLISGYWGMARHLNYLFDLLATICFGLPALVCSNSKSNNEHITINYNIIPHLCSIFLATLLLHRIQRDGEKCMRKYGQYWEKYCQIVPYKLVPYIY